MNRRQLFGAAGLIGLGGIASALPAFAKDWAPVGAPRCVDPRSFGAGGDGKTLDSPAINRAIDACHGAGGGTVYVSPGTYLCGTVVLKSNVTLYLEAGAVLLGSKNVADYTRQPYDLARREAGSVFAADQRDTNEWHLIFARDAENVTITGPGRIDGQGPSFWVPSGRKAPLPENAWQDVATFDWKPLLRPSPMLEFANCKNLRVEQVRIENAAGWTLRPINCENVFILGVTIKNPVFGINTDGLDITGCRNVLVSDCVIDTGDDAICLKSESPYGGEVRPTRNVVVTNCVLSCCCNGLKLGTATFGSFQNITFSNSVLFNEKVDLKARMISGVALEMVDGGSLEGVVVQGIRMHRVRTPIFIRRGGRHLRPDGQPGILRGVMIENIHATESILTSSIVGVEGFAVEDVTLANIRVDSLEAGSAEWGKPKVPENPKAYPESRMFGRLPAYGLFCRHVKQLRLRHLEFGAADGEARPALHCEDVRDLEITGLRSASIKGTEPAVRLVQTQRVCLSGCVAPDGLKALVEVQGAQTARVSVMNNECGGAEKSVAVAPEVPAKAVAETGNLCA